MQHILFRAAVAAAASVLSITAVVAQDKSERIACEVISTTGDFENLEPNFRAGANQANFNFLAPMRPVADDVLLFAEEQGGEIIRGYAAFRFSLQRQADGSIAMERMELHWPGTVVKHEGQLYTIIQIAHDRATPIGLVLELGGNPLGEIELRPGEFDPLSMVVGFNGPTATAVHEKLMENEGFSARLMAAGEVYSTIEPDTAAYLAFVTTTLLPAMDEARRRDTEAPCTTENPMEVLESITF